MTRPESDPTTTDESPTIISLLDLEGLRTLLGRLARLSGVPVSLHEPGGENLLVTEPQDACQRFFRDHPELGEVCREQAVVDLPTSGEPWPEATRCSDGLYRMHLPIEVDGERAAILCVGPFLKTGEVVDRADSRRRAVEAGIDADAYLTALEEVAVCTPQRVTAVGQAYVELMRALVASAAARLREITSQRVLAQQAALLETFLAAIPSPVFYKDAQGRYLGCNPAFTRLTGKSRDELTGRGVDEIWGSEIGEHYAHMDRRLLDRPGQQKYEFRLPDAEGRLRDLVFHKATYRDAGGGVKGIVGVITDITDRKRAESELRKSEARHRVLFESAHDAILLFKNQHVVDCNRKAEEMLDLPRQEILGRSPGDFSPSRQPDGSDSASLIAARIDAARSGDLQTFEWRGRRPDGTGVDTEITLDRIQLGEEFFFLAVVRDVSARKRAAEERRQLEEQLHQVQKMEAVGQLAGGIAHDFNNLLQAVRGYTDLALGDLPSDSTLADYLRQVRRAVDRANTLTRQLLTFSRRQPLQPRLIGVDDLLGDLTNILRRLLGERIELSVSATASTRPVYADPSQIEQILLNLCLNARDALPDGGHITIEVQNVTLDESFRRWRPEAIPGDYVRLQVRDDGLGIPSEIQDRVVEPFFTTKEVGSGSGMGLATVYAIVKRHHGLLELSSEPDRGTTVDVYLPAAEAAAESLSERRQAGVPGGHETLLLAEDDELVRGLATQVLNAAGYHVLAAGDGAEALQRVTAHEGRVDLAILDVVMPKMTGKEVYEALVSRHSDAKVLFSSGYRDLDDAAAELPAGTEFIAKPYAIKDLLSKVRTMLDAAPRR